MLQCYFNDEPKLVTTPHQLVELMGDGVGFSS